MFVCGETLAVDCTLNKEMIAASIVQQHSQHLAFYKAIVEWGSPHVDFYPHRDFSSQYDDELDRVPISRFTHLFNYCGKIELDENGYQKLVGCQEHICFGLEDDFFGHVAVKSVENIFDFITDYLWDLEEELVEVTEYCFYITQGVRVEANIDAGILDHAFVNFTKYTKASISFTTMFLLRLSIMMGLQGGKVAQVVSILARFVWIIKVFGYRSVYARRFRGK